MSHSDAGSVSTEFTHIEGIAGSEVKSIDVEDDILFLHLETSEGIVISGYDLSSGQKVRELRIGQRP